MPTGYTSDLYEGKRVAFSEFAMKCARAFGATIEMRDESLDVPIPDAFTPSTYHAEAIVEAEAKLAEIEGWSDKRAEKEARKAFEERARSANQYNEGNMKRAQAYTGMLKRVNEWTPPTSDHEGLKRFMISQLAESLDFDCFYVDSVPKLLSGKQYRRQLIQRLRRDITYHKKEQKKERRRVEGRNKWVQELRQSLKDSKT